MSLSSPGGLPALLHKRRIFYGWVVVFVSFVVVCLAFGVRLTFGIFFEALTRDSEFGWGRGATAGVFSLSMIVFALGGAPVGWMLDRLGSRRVFVTGILVLVSGLVLTSLLTSLWQFYLFYGVWTGLGITILGLAVHAAMLSRWFDRQGRRGLAIGLAFSGTGVGILLLAPAVERLIAAYNWRVAFLFLALLLVVLALPLTLLLLRDSPDELGLTPDGATVHHSREVVDHPSNAPAAHAPLAHLDTPIPNSQVLSNPHRADWSWARAARTPAFWLLMLSGMLSLFTLRMATVHQVAHFVDNGVSRLTAATVFGSSGLVTALAFIGFGSLSDCIGREQSFYLGSLAQITALGLLIGLWEGAPPVFLYAYALLWGIGEGSRSGLLTAIASDTFPGPAVGVIVGTLGGFFGLGAALGSWLGGAVYDWSGSYVPAFQVALAATLVASASIFAARRLRP